MGGVLRQIAVRGLLANVVLFVVTMALGVVDHDGGFAAGSLVAPVVFGHGLDGPGHARSPLLTGEKRLMRGHRSPVNSDPCSLSPTLTAAHS